MTSPASLASRPATFWLGVGLLLAALIWLLSPVLLPFVVGMAIAYFLNPVCESMSRRGIPRGVAAILVLGVFAVILLGLAVVLGPMITGQLIHFAQKLPGYIDQLRTDLEPRLHHILSTISEEDYLKLQDAATSHAGEAASRLAAAVGNIVAGGVALVETISLLVITPVVAFYLMRDWPVMIARVDSWLPRAQAPVIREQVSEVNRILAGFLRGQAMVCLILGGIYSISLTVMGLHFGILIGIMAGVLSFMPFVGTILGLVCSFIIASLQFGDWTQVGMIVGIFLVAQQVEGNFLTPKLVGESVGLHPVWIIFALMAGGNLLGFTGLLLAVPVAAVLGVLIRFAIRRYLASAYYNRSGRPARRIKPL